MSEFAQDLIGVLGELRCPRETWRRFVKLDGAGDQLAFDARNVGDRCDVPVGTQSRILADLPRGLDHRPLPADTAQDVLPLGQGTLPDGVGDDVEVLRVVLEQLDDQQRQNGDTDDVGRGGRIGHDLLGGVEPRIGGEVVAADGSAELRPVATRLQHGELDPPPVGGQVGTAERVGR